MRRSLETPARFTGTGLHGGARVRATVHPADTGTGIRFRIGGRGSAAGEIPARFDRVTDTRLCTRLGDGDASIGTVEHLMAALAGAGVDDALVVVDGAEIPIMDGSARGFLEGLVDAGFDDRGEGLRPAIRILAPVEVVDGEKRARLEPANAFSLSFAIDFADPAIGRQALALELTGNGFAEELADCRTFGHLSEVEELRCLGLARGGGLDNAVVVDRGRVLNPGGLRRPDEFVRHKILDAVGDLALAGAPIVGRYVAERSGHGMTNRLLRALFDRPDAWEWTTAGPDRLPGGAVRLPPAAEPATACAG